MSDNDAASTEGIEPAWWASAIARGWLTASHVFAYYYSGRIDARAISGFPSLDVEPDDRVRLLGVTATSLVGAEVRQVDNGMSISISRSVLGLGEIGGIESTWRSWIDPSGLDTVDLTPQSGLTAEIRLRSPLGKFGNHIQLPLDRGDYRGESTIAVRHFVDELERRMWNPGGL